MISQYNLDNGSTQVRRHAIIQTNIDQVLRPILVSMSQQRLLLLTWFDFDYSVYK